MLGSGWQSCSPCLKHRSFLPRVLLSTLCFKKLGTMGDSWPRRVNGLQVEKSSLSFPTCPPVSPLPSTSLPLPLRESFHVLGNPIGLGQHTVLNAWAELRPRSSADFSSSPSLHCPACFTLHSHVSTVSSGPHSSLLHDSQHLSAASIPLRGRRQEMFKNPLYRVSQNLKASFMDSCMLLCPQRIFTGLDPTLPRMDTIKDVTACSSLPWTACSLTYHFLFLSLENLKSALSFLPCSP